MDGSMTTEFGKVIIDSHAVAQVAGSTAVECFGIVGMASVNIREGLVKLVLRNRITDGIKVEFLNDNTITIDFHVIVAFGVSIKAVADNLISDVKYKVEEFTGMNVSKINVFVESVRYIDNDWSGGPQIDIKN